jgi:hypothetical protein
LIDRKFPELFEGEPDAKAIEKVVVDRGLQDQVIEFANKTLGNSIIVPSLNSESIQNEDKTELF